MTLTVAQAFLPVSPIFKNRRDRRRMPVPRVYPNKSSPRAYPTPAGSIHRPCNRQQRQRNRSRLRNTPPQPLRHRRNRAEAQAFELFKPPPDIIAQLRAPIHVGPVEHGDVQVLQRWIIAASAKVRRFSKVGRQDREVVQINKAGVVEVALRPDAVVAVAGGLAGEIIEVDFSVDVRVAGVGETNNHGG